MRAGVSYYTAVLLYEWVEIFHYSIPRTIEGTSNGGSTLTMIIVMVTHSFILLRRHLSAIDAPTAMQ